MHKLNNDEENRKQNEYTKDLKYFWQDKIDGRKTDTTEQKNGKIRHAFYVTWRSVILTHFPLLEQARELKVPIRTKEKSETQGWKHGTPDNLWEKEYIPSQSL